MKFFRILYNYFDSGDTENGPELSCDSFITKAPSKFLAKLFITIKFMIYHIDPCFNIITTTKNEYTEFKAAEKYYKKMGF